MMQVLSFQEKKKMSPTEFCYWLQGFFEMYSAGDVPLAPLTHKQMAMIQEHLSLVFNKVTSPAIAADKLAPATPNTLNPLNPLSEDEMKKIIEEYLKKPHPPSPPYQPWDPNSTGPLYPNGEPWWRPQIYCSANGELPASGLRVECMDTSKTSDADLDVDCTATSNNAGTGITVAANNGPYDRNHPLFIC